MKLINQNLYKTFSKVFFSALAIIVCSPVWADYTYNMDPGVSEISRRTYNLHMTIFWICVAIGIVVFSILIYSLIMHRKSKGHEAHDFHENTAVEIIWTVIPFIILISMAVPATSVLKFLDDKSNSEVLVKVTGYQWRWQYEYPEHDINFYSDLTTTSEEIYGKDTKNQDYLLNVNNPLVLPTGKKIRFLFTANDVIHSWWVPKLGIKKDTIPGFINESWVTIDTPGKYYGRCTELCGAKHGFMPIVVDARTPEEYQKWIESQKQPEASATEAKPSSATEPTNNSTEKNNNNSDQKQI